MTDIISRRNFIKGSALTLGALTLAGITGGIESAVASALGDSKPRSKVYFTKDLSPEGIRKLYAMVNQGITGRTAIKLHTGEPDGPNIIPQEWVRAFMPSVQNSTIVECNVLYSSPRQNTAGHRQTLETNGWTFSPVDIMDADGDVPLPISGGKMAEGSGGGKKPDQL